MLFFVWKCVSMKFILCWIWSIMVWIICRVVYWWWKVLFIFCIVLCWVLSKCRVAMIFIGVWLAIIRSCIVGVVVSWFMWIGRFCVICCVEILFSMCRWLSVVSIFVIFVSIVWLWSMCVRKRVKWCRIKNSSVIVLSVKICRWNKESLCLFLLKKLLKLVWWFRFICWSRLWLIKIFVVS